MIVSFTAYLMFCLAIRQTISIDQEETEIDKQLDRNRDTIDNVTPQIWLLRLENTKEKKTIPLKDNYEGFRDYEMKWLLKNSPWYTPLPHLAAPMSNAAILFESSWYSSEVPSIMILHETCGTGHSEKIRYILKAFFLRKFHLNYNIFLWEMNGYMCNKADMFLSRIFGYETDHPLALKQITAFFEAGIANNKIKANQINFIGFGVSAQLSGDIAIKLNGPINSIIGLNPSNKMTFPDVGPQHAKHVQLYHMQSHQDIPGLLPKRNGNGRVDFFYTYYVYTIADPCTVGDAKECRFVLCSDIFVGLLLYPDRFHAWKCDTIQNFEREDENCNTESTAMAYPPINTNEGTYFLRVKPVFPYGVRADGRKFGINNIIENEDDKGEGITYDPTYFHHLMPDQLLEMINELNVVNRDGTGGREIFHSYFDPERHNFVVNLRTDFTKVGITKHHEWFRDLLI